MSVLKRNIYLYSFFISSLIFCITSTKTKAMQENNKNIQITINKTKKIELILNSITNNKNLKPCDLNKINEDLFKPGKKDLYFCMFNIHLINQTDRKLTQQNYKYKKYFLDRLENHLKFFNKEILKYGAPASLSSSNEKTNKENYEIFKNYFEKISEKNLYKLKYNLIKNIFTVINLNSHNLEKKILELKTSGIDLYFFLKNYEKFFEDLFEWKNNNFEIKEELTTKINNLNKKQNISEKKEILTIFKNIIESISNFTRNIEKNKELIQYLFGEKNKNNEEYEEKLNKTISKINNNLKKIKNISTKYDEKANELIKIFLEKNVKFKDLKNLYYIMNEKKFKHEIFYNYIIFFSNIVENKFFKKTYINTKFNPNIKSIASQNETTNKNNYSIYKNYVKTNNSEIHDFLQSKIRDEIISTLHYKYDKNIYLSTKYKKIKDILEYLLEDEIINYNLVYNYSDKKFSLSPVFYKEFTEYKNKSKFYINESLKEIENLELEYEKGKNINPTQKIIEKKNEVRKKLEEKINTINIIKEILEFIVNFSSYISENEDFVKYVFGEKVLQEK